VDGAAREWVRGVGAHGYVLACWDERGVGEEGGYLAAEHQWARRVGAEEFLIVGLEGGA
jgi:hypothetical protein